MKVELKSTNDNPFYGLKACLSLYNNASKGNLPSYTALNEGWREVENDKEKREMFFSLLFSIGDITNRQHNIFKKKKVDNGGSSERDVFMHILGWLRNHHYDQYQNFLFKRIITEYTSFDMLFASRIRTQKKTAKVLNIIDMISSDSAYQDDLAAFTTNVIKGSNPVDKYFVTKFLTRPRLSKRAGHTKMLPETRNVMMNRQALLKKISDLCDFEYYQKGTHIIFKGYYEWRKQYSGEMESVLFSSKKILDFDEQEFLKWLDKLPAGARYRVRRRLLDKDDKSKTDKWSNLPKWFMTWEKFKDQKQKEQRVLEEKDRQGLTSMDEKAKLVQVKKEAKVTTGAVNLKDMFGQVVNGTVDKVKVQPFLDKIKLDYNTLVFVDDSGSMFSRGNSKYGFTAAQFAAFMATICLMKNPDDEARDLLGLFSNGTRMFTHINKRAAVTNSIWNTPPVQAVNEKFIDPSKHFLENLNNIQQFVRANYQARGTDISSIPRTLKQICHTDPNTLEQLMKYPVWTIVSDGEWNNLNSPEASINDMLKQAEQLLGFKPYIVAMDVGYREVDPSRFSGIENFMFIPPNPSQVEQFLTNFKDMDVMDVYTPLQGLHRSNRYAPIRQATL